MSVAAVDVLISRGPKPAPSKAERTRREILALIAAGRPMTADELADRLDLSILYVRPRVSELVTRGDLEASGARGCNASGRPAAKWKLVRHMNGNDAA